MAPAPGPLIPTCRPGAKHLWLLLLHCSPSGNPAGPSQTGAPSWALEQRCCTVKSHIKKSWGKETRKKCFWGINSGKYGEPMSAVGKGRRKPLETGSCSGAVMCAACQAEPQEPHLASMCSLLQVGAGWRPTGPVAWSHPLLLRSPQRVWGRGGPCLRLWGGRYDAIRGTWTRFVSWGLSQVVFLEPQEFVLWELSAQWSPGLSSSLRFTVT